MAAIYQVVFFAVCIFVFPASSRAHYYSTRNNDGSYQFSFGTDDHTRDEVGDIAGNVVGSYRYVSDDNHEREVNYNAGPGLGFQAAGEGILDVPALIDEIRAYRGPWIEPDYPAHWANLPRSYNFAYHAGDSARKEFSDDDGNLHGFYSYLDDEGNQQTVHYEAGIGGYRVLGNNLPDGISSQYVRARESAPSLQQVARPRAAHVDPSNLKISYGGDGSYSFDYDAAGHRRSESADAAGNVGGSFSYVGDDNVNYNVDYSAGSGTGFQAHGAHLPKPTSNGHVSRRVSTGHSPRPSTVASGGRRLHQQRVGVHQPFSVGVGSSRLYDSRTSHAGYSGPGSFYYERRPSADYLYQVGYPQDQRYVTTSGPSHSYNYRTSTYGSSFPSFHTSSDNYNRVGSGYSQLFPGYSSVTLPGGTAYATGGFRHYRSSTSDEFGGVSFDSNESI